MGALSSSRSSFFFFFFLFYLPSDMKLIRIIFIFLLERGSLMSLPLVFFSFFNTLFLFFRALSLREFRNYFFISIILFFHFLEVVYSFLVFIFFFLPRCINLNIFFISIIFLVVFSNAHFHSLPHVRLVFWNSIHLEVASSPFSLLVNSPWL